MATAQQQLLAVEDVLVSDFNFSENDLRQLEEKLRIMMVTLANIEREGLVVMGPNDMQAVGKLAEMKLNKLMEKEKGFILPDKT